MEKYPVYNTSFCKFRSCLIHPICRGSSYLLDSKKTSLTGCWLIFHATRFKEARLACLFDLSFMSAYNPRLVFFGGNAEGLVVLSPWLSRIVRNNHNQHTWFLPAYLQHLSYKYRWGKAYIPFIVTLGAYFVQAIWSGNSKGEQITGNFLFSIVANKCLSSSKWTVLKKDVIIDT